MMDLQLLANLGEVVGAANRVSSIQAALSQDDDISRIFASGVQDAAKLTPLERIRFTWALYESFDAFEFMFLTYKGNEIPEEVWSRWQEFVTTGASRGRAQ